MRYFRCSDVNMTETSGIVLTRIMKAYDLSVDEVIDIALNDLRHVGFSSFDRKIEELEKRRIAEARETAEAAENR